MARIRSIHPGLWTDENFVSMSVHSRLFLIGLWNEADDFGIFEWKPLRLKMRLAPADAIDPEELLNEAVEAGFVVPIHREGKRYGVVKNFRKYQRPKKPGSPLTPVDQQISSIIGLSSSDDGSEPVPHQYGTAPEKSPQMEDGGGVGKGNGEKPNGFSGRASAQKKRGWVDRKTHTQVVNDIIQEIDSNERRRTETSSQITGGDVLLLSAVGHG